MLEQILKQGLFSPAGVRATQRVLDSNIFANGFMLFGYGLVKMMGYANTNNQPKHKKAAQQQTVPQLTNKLGI